jgi:hypothetical protein
MGRITYRTKIPKDGRLIIQLPGELASREVTVDIDVDAEEPAPATQPGNIDEVLSVLEKIRRRQKQDPGFRPRSKEEIDEYLRQERDSWD